MFVPLKRIGTISRANTEAEHYNPHFLRPQPTQREFCGMCDVTTLSMLLLQLDFDVDAGWQIEFH